ncbi:MAG: ribonuclease Z [Gammaproteobacteria bacterium]
MEFVFLGTSSGVPTKTRNVSGLAIRRENAKSWCLVDCGEGTQQRLLHTPLSLFSLAAVFITHIHGDHCYGLPGLLASAALSGRKAPLPVYGPASLRTFIAAVREMTQLRLGYELQWTAVDAMPSGIAVQDFRVDVVGLSHRVPSFAYAFTENVTARKLDSDKLLTAGIPPGPLWRTLQNGENPRLANGTLLRAEDYSLPGNKPRKAVVCGDNDNPELLRECCRDADVLVHEATYTTEIAKKVGAGRQHCAAAKIAEFAQSAALKNLLLTHFSPRYRDDKTASPSIKDIEDEAQRFYRGNLFLANDFDRFLLNREYDLVKIATAETEIRPLGV